MVDLILSYVSSKEVKISKPYCFQPVSVPIQANSIHCLPLIYIACCGAKSDSEHNCALPILLEWIESLVKSTVPTVLVPSRLYYGVRVLKWQVEEILLQEFLKPWDSARVKFLVRTQYCLTAVVLFHFIFRSE